MELSVEGSGVDNCSDIGNLEIRGRNLEDKFK